MISYFKMESKQGKGVFGPYIQFHTCNACGYQQVVKSPGYDKTMGVYLYIFQWNSKPPFAFENIPLHSINLMISQINCFFLVWHL